MEFEFDPAKSAINKDKHGIDFIEAQALWYDDLAVDLEVNHLPEPRRMIVGLIGGKLWTGIYTLRANVVRIISVRRARTQERRRYEENQR